MNKRERQVWIALRAKKVPMIIKSIINDGQEVGYDPPVINITKKDKFYRANGKIISKKLAMEIIRVGWSQ